MSYFGWIAGDASGRDIYSRYISQLTVFVRQLLNDGYQVRLLIGERRTDTQAVRDLQSNLGPITNSKTGHRLVASKIDTVQDVLREIALTDMVVSSRFHNLVLALILGRPVISLGYSAKLEALMEEMELEPYCQFIEDFDANRLKQQVQHLATRYPEKVGKIASKTDKYRERLGQLYDSTFGRVQG